MATIQRIKCHAYERDGAVCTFSQDLKIYTCLHIYIYIIFALRAWKICKKYYEILTIYECVEKKSMIIGCIISITCFELNLFFYDPSWMLQLSDFASSAWVVFNIFPLLDATDRWEVIAIDNFSTYANNRLSIFANTPFNCLNQYKNTSLVY